MSAQWNNEELARSMFSLVKSGGNFKSEKQMSFLREGKMFAGYRRPAFDDEGLSFFKTNYGIQDVKIDDTVYCVDGYVSWADYGRKSNRRMEHLFIMDQYGVRVQYKLHFTYDGGSSTVNEKKTEIVWSRPADAKLVAFEKSAVKQSEAGEFVGAEKQRLVFEGEIKFAAHTGYGTYGATYITVVKCGENTIVYFGLLENIEYRGAVKFKATVKAHNVRDGVNQTIVNRPALVKGV